MIDYGAAKAALLNVAKALSQELGPQGHPRSTACRRARSRPTCGSATTASPRRSARATGVDADAVREQAIAGIADRAASPRRDEVATLVALLASPRTANVTGSNFVIDGGLIKTM